MQSYLYIAILLVGGPCACRTGVYRSCSSAICDSSRSYLPRWSLVCRSMGRQGEQREIERELCACGNRPPLVFTWNFYERLVFSFISLFNRIVSLVHKTRIKIIIAVQQEQCLEIIVTPCCYIRTYTSQALVVCARNRSMRYLPPTRRPLESFRKTGGSNRKEQRTWGAGSLVP